MNSGIKRKHIFNFIGILIVGFWLVMLVILVKKQYVPDTFTDLPDNLQELTEENRNWKEIYLKGKKVGYSINRIRPVENGYYIQDEIFLKLNLMGFEKGLYTITQSSVDSNFFLRNFYFKMNSGVISYRISGNVEGNTLIVSTGQGRRRRRSRINLPKPPMISSGMGFMFKKIDVKVGDSKRLSFFDPSTMTQKDAVFTIAARENLRINRINYDSYKIETEMWGNKLTFWIDMEGNILREEGFMGLTMIKSSAANAPMNIETGNEDDFYELTAVNIDEKLPRANRLKSLRLKVSGIEDADFDKAILNDERQFYKDDVLEIRREEEPFKIEYTLPFPEDRNEFAEYLKPEFNIESDEKEIKSKANEIAGEMKNPVTVIKRMAEWVYRELDKRPVVSIPSAIEVLRTRTGDCNEHATLLVALLRAVKIPARISIGLVYVREKFYYHAWVEAYTGKWITLDPTLNQMPADVTHITLLRGNLDKQVDIMGIMGKLNLEVVDFAYN
ncbi:transglutaminase family protein [Thermodesulfobacteriota bacterium]